MDHKNFKNKNILVTGGLGFIGSNLARRLVEMGSHVTVLDSLIPEYGGNFFNIHGYEDRLNINIADIRDKYSMAQLVKGMDYLFNLAGQTSHIDSMENPFTDLDINCRAQLFILEACRNNNKNIKIVYAGTRQVYGRPRFLPVNEEHILQPTDVNGINKMAGEWYHILYNHIYGIRTCSLRLTNTYGPRMRIKDDRQTFLGIWIRNLVQDKPIEVWGNGLQVRDFNYIDDVVDAILKAAVSKNSFGKIFNLGSHEFINLKDLAASMIKIHGKGEYRIIPFPKDRKNIDIGNYYADFSNARNLLGWEPIISLEAGLEKTFDYYRKYIDYYL